MSEITTRRAIEVCMARLPMNGHTRDAMATYLHNEREKPSQVGIDAEAMKATLEHVMSLATGIDASFAKTSMLCRFEMIRDAIRRGQA